MSQSNASETQLQNLVEAITRSVIDERPGQINRLIESSDVPEAAVTDLTDIILGMHDVLQPQAPSERFMQHLKHDLIGQPDTLVARLRSIPGRVHVATGLAAAFAGLMWIIRRRDDHREDMPEIPVLQQQ